MKTAVSTVGHTLCSKHVEERKTAFLDGVFKSLATYNPPVYILINVGYSIL